MKVIDWGLISYTEASEKQLSIVEEVVSGADEVLVVCKHPPVVTLGRGTKDEDVFDWHGEIIPTSRGGRATYHGPNQIIVYPILNLNYERKSIPPRDPHAYLRKLEQAIVATLAAFQLPSESRTVKNEDGSSLTGVWIGDKKVASIGIAIKKWVTYHGLALNVTHDPRAFFGIQPCGYSSTTMTDMQKEQVLRHLAIAPELEVKKLLIENLVYFLKVINPSSCMVLNNET